MKLEQKQVLQHVVLPEQILLANFLSMENEEIEETLQAEADQNPFLELESREDGTGAEDSVVGGDADEGAPDPEIESYSYFDNSYEEEPPKINPRAGRDPSYKEEYHEVLLKQLQYLNLTPEEKEIAQYMIGELNEDGFFTTNLLTFSYKLEIYHNIKVTPEQLEEILKKLQKMEPPGIFARNLQESLLIQLKHCQETPAVRHAMEIVANHFNHLANKNFSAILSKMKISEEELKAAVNVISSLNPKPLSPISENKTIKRNPRIDFVLRINENGEFNISIEYIPMVRVNYEYFAELLSRKEIASNPELVEEYKKKYESAKNLAAALLKREITLRRIITAIVNFQKEFFLEGDRKKIKPMKLKDIAEITGYDISTVSRATSKRYIDTPFGVIPLRELFSERASLEEGDESTSTRAIKQIIRELIEGEDKKNPLTDLQIAKILRERGYRVARRTVAKYREQMGILPSKLRKGV